MQSTGHIGALKHHLKSNLFIRADISEFFNSINRSRVTRELKKFYPSYDVAREQACKSVVPSPFKKGQYILPFGFTQSPLIASICLSNSRLGSFLNAIRNNGYKVSVYMDDIIISDGGMVSKEDMLQTFDILNKVASHSKFQLQKNKTVAPTNKVTAFNIELSNNKLKINTQRFKQLLQSALQGNDEVKKGIIGYVNSVSNSQKIELKNHLSLHGFNWDCK